MKGGGEPGMKTGAGAGDAWRESAGDGRFQVLWGLLRKSWISWVAVVRLAV